MEHSVWISPGKQNITVPHGGNLMEALRRTGFGVDAPCGGRGRCGKCKVLVDGKEELVCRDNGLAYHHGERTITYTACILF